MGVDISFHIEVRCRDKWRPVIWQTPMELKSYLYKEDEGKEWYTGHCMLFVDWVDKINEMYPYEP